MDREIAQRLWAMATLLRSGNVNRETMNTMGEVCDDIAMVIVQRCGFSYDELSEAAEVETFEPTYKFSKMNAGENLHGEDDDGFRRCPIWDYIQ